MALIICPECGKQISDKVASCPHCGYPLSKLSNDTVSSENKQFFPTPLDDSWADEILKKRKVRIVICIILAFFTFALTLFGCLGGAVKRKIHGYTILAIHNGFSGKLFIENKLVEKTDGRDCYGELPDGTTIHVHFSAWDGSPSISIEGNSNTNIESQTIYVNNTQIENKKIIKKGKKNTNSDMERILIKNAKMDTLASINPNDTKDTKEKIKIINDLDDLND